MAILSELDNAATKHHQLSKIMNVEVDDIERNPLNTAPLNYLDELEVLIKQNGIIEPVVLYKVANHQYRLLAGERRFTIAKRLNYETLPALIVDAPVDPIDEEMLIKLHNVQRPDDIDTLREKITGFKNICDRKRERGDQDVKGIRTTDWISQQLGGLSPRTVQEYLTGKYSESYANNLVSEIEGEDNTVQATPKKIKSLKSISKMIEKLRRDLEELDLSHGIYNYKDLIELEYECGEAVMDLSQIVSDISSAKELLRNERD